MTSDAAICFTLDTPERSRARDRHLAALEYLSDNHRPGGVGEVSLATVLRWVGTGKGEHVVYGHGIHEWVRTTASVVNLADREHGSLKKDVVAEDFEKNREAYKDAVRVQRSYETYRHSALKLEARVLDGLVSRMGLPNSPGGEDFEKHGGDVADGSQGERSVCTGDRCHEEEKQVARDGQGGTGAAASGDGRSESKRSADLVSSCAPGQLRSGKRFRHKKDSQEKKRARTEGPVKVPGEDTLSFSFRVINYLVQRKVIAREQGSNLRRQVVNETGQMVTSAVMAYNIDRNEAAMMEVLQAVAPPPAGPITEVTKSVTAEAKKRILKTIFDVTLKAGLGAVAALGLARYTAWNV